MKLIVKIVYLCKLGWIVNILLIWKWCIKVKIVKIKLYEKKILE